MVKIEDETSIWNNKHQPNINQKVIVIDKNGDIQDFGYFYYNDHVDFKQGFKWAYMSDLIKATNGKKE